MDNNPFTFIEKFLDVLFLQVVQINESEMWQTGAVVRKLRPENN